MIFFRQGWLQILALQMGLKGWGVMWMDLCLFQPCGNRVDIAWGWERGKASSTDVAVCVLMFRSRKINTLSFFFSGLSFAFFIRPFSQMGSVSFYHSFNNINALSSAPCFNSVFFFSPFSLCFVFTLVSSPSCVLSYIDPSQCLYILYFILYKKAVLS